MTTSTSHRRWATLTVCCLAALVPSIDLTTLNLAIPHLIADLHPSATQILWIADMYGFTLAGLLVTMGSVGDRIGHKRLLLLGGAVFAAASALTAYSNSAAMLIGTRAVLGVAGATIMPSALSLIRRAFDVPKERTMAVGIFSGVGALGVGIGPVVGGLLLDHFWWGSVFLINVPLMIIICVAGAVLLTESHGRPHRLDPASIGLSIVGMLAVVYTIKQAALGHIGAPRVVLTLVVGVLALAVFLRRQTRLAQPLIDLSLFRRAAFTGSVVTDLFAMFALVAQSLIFSQYFQQVLGWSPLKAGLAGLPGALFAMLGGALAAPLITVLGRARLVGLGMTLSGGGFALYALAGTQSHYLLILAGMFAGAAGLGLALTVTGDTMLAAVPRDRSGAASAISETATELGGALGMAVLGSVLNATYRSRLDAPAGLPAGARDGLHDSLGSALQAVTGLPAGLRAAALDAGRQAFVDGMHAALLCSAGLAVLVGLLGLRALRSVPKVIEPVDLDPDLDPAELDSSTPAGQEQRLAAAR